VAIYTRGGDDGTTGLPGDRRISKACDLAETLGTLDELNSLLGVCAAEARRDDHETIRAIEERICLLQKDLLAAGASLALGVTQAGAGPGVSQADVDRLETWIDEAWSASGELTQFIVPGGTALAAHLHVARTVARRAERRLVACRQSGLSEPEHLGTYLNRLSDCLFALARWANVGSGGAEQTWK
jgi:cob(I)alamin adenosyltransferase